MLDQELLEFLIPFIVGAVVFLLVLLERRIKYGKNKPIKGFNEYLSFSIKFWLYTVLILSGFSFFGLYQFNEESHVLQKMSRFNYPVGWVLASIVFILFIALIVVEKIRRRE